jgi:hypothetical protein
MTKNQMPNTKDDQVFLTGFQDGKDLRDWVVVEVYCGGGFRTLGRRAKLQTEVLRYTRGNA